MTDIEETESEFDLEHHGILGMKWGRRKSREVSGTGMPRKAKKAQRAAARAAKVQARRTQKARRRAEYNAQRAIDNRIKSQKSAKSLNTSRDHRRYQEFSRKKLSEMSTNEINEWVNRTNAIKNYKRLHAGLAEKGVRAVMNMGRDVTKDLIKSVIKGYIRDNLLP